MGFGYSDSDWVDPPELPVGVMHCPVCSNGVECPCGCGMFWCEAYGCFVRPDVGTECEGMEVC